MKNPVYIVTMYRWGDRESHSYVLGAYSTKTKAEKAGQKEKEYRGGTKYYPECIEVVIDEEYGSGFKTIVALEHNPNFCKGHGSEAPHA